MAQSILVHDAAPERRARERRRAMARTARHVVLGAAILALTAGVVVALRPRPVPVDVATVTRGPLVVAIQESGVTRVKDRYVVSAPVTGSLSRVAFEPGDAVREGDALAQIAPALSPLLDERSRAEADARLGAATSALGQAKAQQARAAASRELSAQDLAREQRLFDSGSVPRQSLDEAIFLDRMRAEELSSAEFAVKVASEDVRVARAQLGRGGDRLSARAAHVDVIAPASGRVLRVQQKSAGVVAAGAPLLEVGDPAALEVVVDLLTTDAVNVRPGTEATLLGWGGERTIAGRVRQIEPSAFTKPSALGVDEQRVNVVIAFVDPRDAWAALGDGYRVEARLVLWSADDALKVPLGAVFKRGDGWAVFTIEEGRARLARVEVGHRGEAEIEVKGLAPGAVVAVHPGDRVKDGVRVSAR